MKGPSTPHLNICDRHTNSRARSQNFGKILHVQPVKPAGNLPKLWNELLRQSSRSFQSHGLILSLGYGGGRRQAGSCSRKAYSIHSRSHSCASISDQRSAVACGKTRMQTDLRFDIRPGIPRRCSPTCLGMKTTCVGPSTPSQEWKILSQPRPDESRPLLTQRLISTQLFSASRGPTEPQTR